VDRCRRGGPVLSVSGARGEVRVQEPSALERTLARRAAEARATVPQLELTVELETPPDLATLVRACALALREHPRANGAYRDGHFELYSRVNVGVIVDLDEGHLIPTLFDADRKPLQQLSDELLLLTEEARAGRLASPAFSGATFTLWPAAALGVWSASIPTVPPQAAALAAGTGALTLTCDHRILYGARAAAFLADVKSRLARRAVS
jgi:pyruvate dehydrogenase E2 component (dihydrolipoyllysine-residue acetyltransferase)